MKVLVINGSPKGEKSNTLRLARAFLEGMEESGESIRRREVAVGELNLRPCLGCFGCWDKTPGRCCIRDDMAGVLESLLWAEVTVWSFPLYYYSVPGPLKTLIDRQLPLCLPFMSAGAAGGGHPERYDRSGQRTVVISTCGFYTAEGNYDGVKSLFDHLCGEGNYTPLFCGQGELFRVPQLEERTGEYLARVRRAGREYLQGGITPETREELGKLLLPRKVFEELADASWGIGKESGEKESDTLVFTRQMAALYRKESWPGRDLILEMNYTDVGERYQIVLGREGSRVLTRELESPTTTVETPVTVWRSISAGELSGSEALVKHLYRVEGDFSLLMDWDRYFGAAGASSAPGEGPAAGPCIPARPTDLNALLLPWLVFWVAVPVHSHWGSLGSLAACALTPLIFFRSRRTVYDLLSAAAVTGLSAAVLAGVSSRLAVPLGYLAFGVMWTASCLGKIPLTAHYSMWDYGGEKALENALFLKTNRILTLAWGALYLVTPVWTYLLMGTAIGGWVGAVNCVLPAVMGVFTDWFRKWYPARAARG